MLSIQAHGGVIIDDEDLQANADVVIAHHEELSAVRHHHSHSRTLRVEGIDFVNTCINRGWYGHGPIEKKGLGGRPPGAPAYVLLRIKCFATLMSSLRRVNYTAQDDRHLAQYIAKRIPDKDEGGRQGNNLYQELVAHVRYFIPLA